MCVIFVRCWSNDMGNAAMLRLNNRLVIIQKDSNRQNCSQMCFFVRDEPSKLFSLYTIKDLSKTTQQLHRCAMKFIILGVLLLRRPTLSAPLGVRAKLNFYTESSGQHCASICYNLIPVLFLAQRHHKARDGHNNQS